MDARSSLGIVAVMLIVVALACMGVMTVAGYAVNWNAEGLSVRNPQVEAEATRTALAAQDASAQRALALDTERRVQPAAVIGRALFYILIGVAGGVLVVGSAFAAVAWLNKRATTVYPNQAGQYPVIVSRGWGWVTYHDPSRGLSPGAVYRVPTVLDVAANVLARLMGKPVDRPAITSEYPPAGSEEAMLQVASQSNAISLAAAANRWPQVSGGGGPVMGNAPVMQALPVGRMPSVRDVKDAEQIDRMERILLSVGL